MESITWGDVAAFLTAIAALITAISTPKKVLALLDYRLGQVEKKIDSHNGYAEKFAKNSEQMADIRQDIAVIKTKVEMIEGRG